MLLMQGNRIQVWERQSSQAKHHSSNHDNNQLGEEGIFHVSFIYMLKKLKTK
jgi:hypothetical protein